MTLQPIETGNPRVDRDLFRIYVARNTETYEATLDKLEFADPRLKKQVVSWCWPALLVTLPWLMYRKQWGLAALITFLPIVIALLFPSFGSGGSAGIAGVFGVGGKSLYVMRAAKQLEAITALADNPQHARELAALRGGVSVPGAVLGSVALIVSLGLALFMGTNEQAAGIN